MQPFAFTRRALLAATLTFAVTSTALADQKSEAAAADLLKRRLKNENPEDVALLGAVKGKDIVVVAGSMDHIEQVLAASGIRYTLIQPNQVAEAQLTSSQIVMVNCPGTMPMSGVKRLERFVRAGGLLYTTDWSLANVVEKGFPGTIAHNGQGTGNEVVPVAIAKEDDNLMSRMLLSKGMHPQWWLEGGSFPIRVLDEKKVTVLASSKEMKDRYGAAPVVVRIRWEDGEIIHVVSHFYRQMKTQGVAVSAKEASGSFEGLTAADKKAFAESEGGTVNAGDVASSYAFQRMTTNLVTGKQRRNVELDKMYDQTVAAPAPMMSAPTPAAAPVGESRPGTRMKVLERKDDKVRVRDEAGNEGWVSKDALIQRQ